MNGTARVEEARRSGGLNPTRAGFRGQHGTYLQRISHLPDSTAAAVCEIVHKVQDSVPRRVTLKAANLCKTFFSFPNSASVTIKPRPLLLCLVSDSRARWEFGVGFWGCDVGLCVGGRYSPFRPAVVTEVNGRRLDDCSRSLFGAPPLRSLLVVRLKNFDDTTPYVCEGVKPSQETKPPAA